MSAAGPPRTVDAAGGGRDAARGGTGAARAAGSGGRLRAVLGLALVAVVWPTNWLLDGLRTHLLFFPLWLGYVLAIDGWTELRTGDSLYRRSRRGFVALFALSIPFWWIFELLNRHLGNWEYVGGDEIGDLAYVVLSSIAFSTVVPAVLATAELVRGARWIERFARGPRVRASRRLSAGLFGAGALMIVALALWPRAAYPFAWIAGVFLLEPLCRALGRRSLTSDLERGDWRPWIALWVGGLVCGFFWELWNVRGFPKWIYHTPGVGGPQVFEMPLPGYLGYLPFSLEVFLWKELFLRAPRLRL